MRKAQIENGVVTNIILVDPDNVPDWAADLPDATPDAEIGAAYANGVFTPPPAPEPPVPQTLSFPQTLIGLVEMGWITEAEGEAWLDGTLPTAVTYAIDFLPADQRFAAKARAKRPSEVLRTDGLLALLAAMNGKTEADLDLFFRTYSTR